MDISEYITVANLTAFIAAMVSATGAVVSYKNYSMSKSNYRLQCDKFETDRENFAKELDRKNGEFKKELDRKNDEFKEQKKQFESNLRSQQSKTYKELIVAERIKWLNGIRTAMCEMIAFSRVIANNCINSTIRRIEYEKLQWLLETKNKGISEYENAFLIIDENANKPFDDNDIDSKIEVELWASFKEFKYFSKEDYHREITSRKQKIDELNCEFRTLIENI